MGRATLSLVWDQGTAWGRVRRADGRGKGGWHRGAELCGARSMDCWSWFSGSVRSSSSPRSLTSSLIAFVAYSPRTFLFLPHQTLSLSPLCHIIFLFILPISTIRLRYGQFTIMPSPLLVSSFPPSNTRSHGHYTHGSWPFRDFVIDFSCSPFLGPT
jgi:hypothetical protein